MLKVKSIRKKQDEYPSDFLERFIKRAPATYELDGTLECEEGKLRTYDAIKRVMEHYYPERINSLPSMLRGLINRHAINAVYCGDVGDVTFFPYHPEGKWAKGKMFYNYRAMFLSLGIGTFFMDVGVFPYTGYDRAEREGKPAEVARLLGVSFRDVS